MARLRRWTRRTTLAIALQARVRVFLAVGDLGAVDDVAAGGTTATPTASFVCRTTAIHWIKISVMSFLAIIATGVISTIVVNIVDAFAVILIPARAGGVEVSAIRVWQVLTLSAIGVGERRALHLVGSALVRVLVRGHTALGIAVARIVILAGVAADDVVALPIA